MGRVRWTLKAANHLHAIHEYISKDSRTYATRFIKSLIKTTDKLKTLPQSGRIVPELENYGFRELIFQNYRIVYRISSTNCDIEILAVVHGARVLTDALENKT
jgi:toxin ParE1/3/4